MFALALMISLPLASAAPTTDRGAVVSETQFNRRGSQSPTPQREPEAEGPSLQSALWKLGGGSGLVCCGALACAGGGGAVALLLFNNRALAIDDSTAMGIGFAVGSLSTALGVGSMAIGSFFLSTGMKDLREGVIDPAIRGEDVRTAARTTPMAF